MIDTIKLNLMDCDIKKTCDLTIQLGTIKLKTGECFNDEDLFYNSAGEIVRGSKAFLNTDKWNLTILPSIDKYKLDRKTVLNRRYLKREIQDGSGMEVEESSNGIFLQTSLPRLKAQYNFKSVSMQDEKQLLKYLESELKDHGIKTNIWNSELSRLDSFVNLNTDHTFFNYTPLFSLMDCSRKKSVEWNGETFLWKNSQGQITIYDKIREMISKDKNFSNPFKNTAKLNNVLRIENRYLKKRKIKDTLGITRLADLYKNYNILTDNFKKEISGNIFKYELPEIDLLTDSQIKNEMLSFKKHFNRNWFQKYLTIKGVQAIAKSNDINSIFEIFESIESKGNVRVKKTRIRKMISEMQMILPQNNFCTYKTNRELYNELRTKFFKQVA